jgi:Fuc2NAc and GlcNAc transferase
MTYGLFLFTVVTCLSYFAVRMVRRMSVARELMDVPNERSSHTEPIPHGAGLVIVAVGIVGYIVIALIFSGSFSWGYVSGGLLIAAVSFLDDIRPIRFTWRLMIHGIAAFVLIADVDTWHGITMLGKLQFGVWGYVVTFLWIVWMINCYNFMDGIDGLAGLQAVVGGLAWVLLSYMLEMPVIFFFSGAIAAANLGFLVHNWNPAKIFMGDLGATFLGFTFAAIPLLARTNASRYPDLLPIAAVLFLWMFLFDALMTLLRRAMRGEKVWTPHKEHLFQRLVSSGLSHRRVTLLYGVLASVLIVSVLLSVKFREDIGLAMLPVVVVLSTVLLLICFRRGVLI